MSKKIKSLPVDVSTGELVQIEIPFFQTAYNRKAQPHRYEVSSSLLPSQTIPDQTMTVPEMLERHAKGLSVSGAKTPIYHGEGNDPLDGIQWEKLDLSEKQDLLQRSRERVQEIQEELSQKALRRTQVAQKSIETKKEEDNTSDEKKAKNEPENNKSTNNP